jgi:hypothetical protein
VGREYRNSSNTLDFNLTLPLASHLSVRASQCLVYARTLRNDKSKVNQFLRLRLHFREGALFPDKRSDKGETLRGRDDPLLTCIDRGSEFWLPSVRRGLRFSEKKG